MPRTALFRFLLALGLVAALAMPATAAPHLLRTVQPQSSTALNTLYGYLAHLWAAIGCGIDPDGKCTIANPTQAGCGADPSGCKGAIPTANIGCGADPNGRCTSAPATAIKPQPRLDIGCGIDPSGICTTDH